MAPPIQPPALNPSIGNAIYSQAATTVSTPALLVNLPYTQVAILQPENNNDSPLYGRVFDTPFQVPLLTLNRADFEAFAAQRYIDIKGIDVQALFNEISNRAS